MKKTNVEAIIKKSSLVIMILSLLGAVLYVLTGLGIDPPTASTMRNHVFGVKLGCFIDSAVLAASALIFFRVFRSGRPFTRGNVWAVRGVAGLFVVKVMIQSMLEAGALGFIKAFAIKGIDSIFYVALFLVVAEILRYGALLQTESDETL